MESPKPPSELDHDPAVEGKPALVTTLCVFGVIVGGIGLCSPVIYLLPHTGAAATSQPVNPFTVDRTVHLWELAGVIVNFVLSILLIASAVGSMTLKPAARRGMVAWAMLALAVSIGFYFLSTNILEPRIAAMMASLPVDQRPPESAKKIGHVKAGLGIAYELLVLFVFTRPSVVDSFEKFEDRLKT